MTGVSDDILHAMIALEGRRRGKLNEIPELEKISNGLSGQMDSQEGTGYFLLSNAYIPAEPMLSAQRHFSVGHDKIEITHDWQLDLVFPEIRKKIELFDRLRIHEEHEGDIDLAISYLVVLHQHVLNAMRPRRKRCFG